MSVLVSIDTETTGLHAGRQAWDIAMIRRDDQGESTMQVFVVPEDSANCLYAVGTEDEGDYVTERTAAHLVAHWTHGAYIVGSNPRFDLETLEPLLRRHGLTPSWQYHAGDVACMAGGPPPWKLAKVAERYDVKPPPEDEAHTALGDARWALAVYDAIVGGKS